MKKKVDISVSTLTVSDYQQIIEYAKQLQGVADLLHCDILNENFVQTNTYDFNLLKNINRNSLIMLDVHLMVNEPMLDIPKYIEAGANIVTVHYEAFEDKENLVKTLEYIKQNHALAGIALNPSTPLKEVRSYMFGCDVVLVMGVVPGKSGQALIPEMIDRVKEIFKFREENNLSFKIELDGGVNVENASILAEAGADILVSGAYVYKSDDRAKAIETLKGE